MKNIHNLNFPNFGFVGADLTEEELAPIWDEVNEIQSDFSKAVPMQPQLVGNLNHEYLLIRSKPLLERMTRSLIPAFAQSFQLKTRDPATYHLDRPWVNFQRKHEFNPLHKHSGEFSFVLWLQIPYTKEDELRASPGVLPDRNCAGCFTFQYIDVLGSITPWSIPADNTYEGRLILFPAALNHSVHPFFSSDEYRISISGNLGPEGTITEERISFM